MSMPSRFNEDGLGGFTLSETLVVLTLLAIVTTGAATWIARRPSGADSLDAMADRAAVLLRTTRAKAILRRRPAEVIFDPDGRRLISDDGESSLFLSGTINASALGTTSDGSRGEVRFLFLPDGSSSGGGLTLRSGGGTVEISLSWLTGTVQISREGNNASRE
jgi:general secretion pathway protein H